MIDQHTKLNQDLEILIAMANEMDRYLIAETLFQQMSDPGLPKLTLGGYLMRQHRLSLLQDHLLSDADQKQLSNATEKVNQIFKERKTFLEKKANHELAARTRQWQAYLEELNSRAAANYPVAVETRAMIAALTALLEQNSVLLKEDTTDQVEALDRELRTRWQSDDFIWPNEWQPAYPSPKFWWLYGRPQ